MSNKKRYIKVPALTGIIAMLMLCFVAVNQAAIASAAESKTVNAGSTWAVDKTTRLSGLTIAEGAVIKAPDGKSLTMTVDGIGTAIKPGAYNGDILITVTDSFFAPSSGLMRGGKQQEFRAAILIEDGRYVSEKSVAEIVQGGKVTDKTATGVTITGCEDNFNGIVVNGDSEYTIEGLKIDFEGNGDNDFIGYGAGIACYGDSKVTVNNSEIKFKSVTRCALHCGGNSVTTLNNCRLINESPDKEGFLPMWALGLSGTNRVTQLCDNATVYYNNCHIQGNGWGALSIDGGKRVRMYLKDSTIELTGPRARGYGAFSIGDALISYDNCKINVQGYPLLLGGHNDKSDGEITNGTVINSTAYGVMMFRLKGGELKVNKGSTINTASSTFLVKGCNPYLDIDNAVLNPGNGVILQLMDNDDPGMGPSRFIVPIGSDVAIPGRDLTAALPDKDVFMTISNMEVKGDFYNSTTNLRANSIESASMSGMPAMSSGSSGEATDDLQGVKNLEIKFANVKVNGIISAAKAAYRDGVAIIDPSNRKELSAVTQTAHEPINNGVIVSFDKDSVWTVAGTSYLTSLTIDKGAVIKAPGGKTLTMTVNGVKTPIKAGTYKGKIVMIVS
ncbi:MAG: hypothetical protein JW944_09730 [Deltaproteobacteria bacterium]|nr:hypothetical protein [Deltaproteobacteria bacterium]